MADAAVLANSLITSVIQGVKALKLASTNLDEAPANLKRLENLVEHLDEALARAERKHSDKFHNGEFRGKFQDLTELAQGFKTQVANAKKLAATRKGVRRFLACCWSAAVGDELLRIAFSMETQLHSWTEQQNVPLSIGEALERYTQGLPSYLTLKPEDGYQPLVSKVGTVCELLQSSPRKTVLLHGLSGIGKSSLAHYVAANRLPNRFQDGSTRILLGYGCSRRAVGNDTLAYQKVFAEKVVYFLRCQLGYKRHDTIDGISLGEAFILLEETLKGKNYLIIIDDVWEADVVVRFSKLQGNSCKYLVTSRLYGIVSSDAEKVELTKEDVAPVGKEILRYHSRMLTLPDVADVLLERCGFHPLTITVIGQALEGEYRSEQWNQALSELSVYASSAYVSSNNVVEDDVSNTATVFGSLEFSLNAMERDYRDLFTTFSVISWVEPIPEACLEGIWRALQLQGTFKMAMAALLRGSLIGKHKSSYSYVIHDMVALYLRGKQQEAMKLLKLTGTEELETVAPWLYRYGNEKSREESAKTLLRTLRSGPEFSKVDILDSVISVCSACRSLQDWTDTSREFVILLGPEIPRLLPGISVGGRCSESVIRFITSYYTQTDWEYHVTSFIDCGIVLHLQPLLKLRDESLKSMVHVVRKLASFLPAGENMREALENMPVNELVQLLDPGSKGTRNFVGESVMTTFVVLAKAGGPAMVERMFAAGLGKMILEQIKSDFEEFSGSGMRELNLLREYYLEGGSLIVGAFLESGLLSTLPDDRYRDYFSVCLILV